MPGPKLIPSVRSPLVDAGAAIAIVIALALPAIARAESTPAGGNLLGHRGLLRSVAALNHPAGTIGLGTDLQYFSAGSFLPSRTGTTAQEHSRLVNTYSITWAPWSFLEAAVAMHVISDNSVDGKSEELQVAVGDPQISIKGGYRFGSLAVGGLFDLRFPSGAGYFEPAASATNITFAILGSWTGGRKMPLSAHINIGLAIDGSANLFGDASKLSAAQQYAAQLSSFNRLVARVGFEYDTRYVGPFVELSLEPFMGSGAPGFGKSPGLLSFGARIWPTKTKGLQMLAALDVGIAGVGKGQPSSLAAGKYAYVIPRWNLVFRLSYRFDPFAEPKVIVKDGPKDGTDDPVAAEKTGRISGKVVDGRSGNPIWNARVKLGGSEISQLAVDPKTGTFRTFQLKPGSQEVSASADGYVASSVTVTVEADGTAEATIKLMPRTAITPGTVRGSVKAVGGKEVRKARVLIPELDKTLDIGADGSFTVQLKPGVYKIVVSARGYRTQRKKIRVLEGSTVILNLELHRGRR